MKKINLRGISEILSEKELKNVMGGSSTDDCWKSCSSDSDCKTGCLHCVYQPWGNADHYCMSQA